MLPSDCGGVSRLILIEDDKMERNKKMNNQIYQTPIKHRSRAAEFRLRARIALAGRWWLSIGVLLLFYLLSTVPLLTMVLYESPLSLTMFDEEEYLEYLVQNVVTPSNLALMFMASLICLAYQIFVMAPLQAGYAGFRLGLLDRKPDVGVPELFSCFRRGNRYYWKAVGAYGLYYLILYGIFLVMALVPVVLLVLFGSSGMLVQLPVLAVLVYAFVVIWVLACLAGMVVVTYQYALIPYIVMEYPELGAMDQSR